MHKAHNGMNSKLKVKQYATALLASSDPVVSLVNWISDTLSQGYTVLQSLV